MPVQTAAFSRQLATSSSGSNQVTKTIGASQVRRNGASGITDVAYSSGVDAAGLPGRGGERKRGQRGQPEEQQGCGGGGLQQRQDVGDGEAGVAGDLEYAG